jgi:hypothetical protein
MNVTTVWKSQEHSRPLPGMSSEAAPNEQYKEHKQMNFTTIKNRNK